MSQSYVGWLTVGSLASLFLFEKYSNMLESYTTNILPSFPYFTYFDLGLVIIGLTVFFIWLKKSKDSEEKLSDHKLQGKIKHIENDLLPAYRRLIGLETEEKDSKLVFLVNPLHKRRKPNPTFDEAYQEVWEMEHTPKTPLEALTDGGSALEHLKNKDYKDIYQHFKKAEELVDKFNQNHDESLKPQIDESVQNFRIGLVHLIDRLDNNHLLKGKCSSCP